MTQNTSSLSTPRTYWNKAGCVIHQFLTFPLSQVQGGADRLRENPKCHGPLWQPLTAQLTASRNFPDLGLGRLKGLDVWAEARGRGGRAGPLPEPAQGSELLHLKAWGHSPRQGPKPEEVA